jgi:hypothetical protein
VREAVEGEEAMVVVVEGEEDTVVVVVVAAEEDMEVEAEGTIGEVHGGAGVVEAGTGAGTGRVRTWVAAMWILHGGWSVINVQLRSRRRQAVVGVDMEVAGMVESRAVEATVVGRAVGTVTMSLLRVDTAEGATIGTRGGRTIAVAEEDMELSPGMTPRMPESKLKRTAQWSSVMRIATTIVITQEFISQGCL